MALELIKENMVVEQIVGENRFQALVSHDIVIGDFKPDVEKVLSVSAYNNIIRHEIVQGKAVIEGILNCSILYTGDTDKLIECVDTQIPYTQYVDIKGAENKMTCEVSDYIEGIDASIVSGRKISLNVLIDLNIRVIEKKSIDVIADISGLPDIQLLKKEIKVNSTVGQGTSQEIVREELELPQNKLDIAELLKTEVNVVLENTVVKSGKVTAEGYVSLTIMYYTGESVHPLEKAIYELPFVQVTDVPGAEEGMSCDVRFYIEDTSFKVVEDENGKNRIISAEVLLKCVAKVRREDTMEVIIDAYSTVRATQLSKSTYRYRELVGEEETQVEVKEVINLSEPATNIYDVNVRPVVVDYNVYDEKVVCSGVLQVSIIYMTSGGNTVVTGDIQEVPFNAIAEIPNASPDIVVDVEATRNKFTYELKSPRQLDLKALLNVRIDAFANRDIELLTAMDELDIPQPERASITVYMVQKDDDLWNIAKRYRTSKEDILKANGLQEEELKPGLKLLIPKKFVL